jgi:hypothetical protein
LYVTQGEIWALQDNLIDFKMGIDDTIMKLIGANTPLVSTEKAADIGGIEQPT